MNRIVRLLTLILAAGLVSPASAGVCTHEAQECLDYLVTMRNRGYAGIDIDDRKDDGTMTITKVHAGTPAAASGIRIGDVLLAIEGIRIGDEEGMKALDEVMKPDNLVHFTVSREGKERTFELKLSRMPDDVFAQFVGEHMLLHVTDAASKE
jgi:C-terminal processing protease CtpA/Prc